jgi:hypothetical membrane protein
LRSPVKEYPVRTLALGGVAGPVLFTSVVILCAALRPEYSHLTQFMSELGESGGPHASLMNFLGFIPSGLLLAGFGVSLAFLRPSTAFSLAAATLIAIFGLGITAAGAYSCDPGCPREGISFEATVHRVVSVIAFIAGIVGTALWAYRFRGLPAWRSLRHYSAVTSAAALVLLLVLNASVESRAYSGLWQRLFLATLYVWCAVVGLRLFGSSTPGKHAS